MTVCLQSGTKKLWLILFLAAVMNVSLLQIAIYATLPPVMRGRCQRWSVIEHTSIQFSSKPTWDKRHDVCLQRFTVPVCLCHVEEELRKLREETNVDSLRQELDRERSKRLELEQKMNEVVKSRWESLQAEVSAWKSSEYYPNRWVTASEVNRAPLVSRSAHWRASECQEVPADRVDDDNLYDHDCSWWYP